MPWAYRSQPASGSSRRRARDRSRRTASRPTVNARLLFWRCSVAIRVMSSTRQASADCDPVDRDQFRAVTAEQRVLIRRGQHVVEELEVVPGFDAANVVFSAGVVRVRAYLATRGSRRRDPSRRRRRRPVALARRIVSGSAGERDSVIKCVPSCPLVVISKRLISVVFAVVAFSSSRRPATAAVCHASVCRLLASRRRRACSRRRWSAEARWSKLRRSTRGRRTAHAAYAHIIASPAEANPVRLVWGFMYDGLMAFRLTFTLQIMLEVCTVALRVRCIVILSFFLTQKCARSSARRKS